jgi:TatD DNase family protein
MYIDSHCHIDKLDDIGKIVENSKNAGVGMIISNGLNPTNNKLVLELSMRFKEVKAALGMYPIDSLELKKSEINREIEFIKKNSDKIIAIGEVGLDFKEGLETRKKQEKTFREFVKLAKALDKPVIVHSRKAEKECIEILEELNSKKVIMHCFSGKLKLVRKIFSNGWFLTIPTCVKHSEHFQKIIEICPIENLLCETDSPYLHPEKKFPNEPANVIESYKAISKIKDINLDKVEKKIQQNFKRLFS